MIRRSIENKAARFSAERRVKLIITLILAAVMTLLCMPAASAQASQSGQIKLDTIRTTWNDENYSVFTVRGNRISARGRYAGDRIRKLYISDYEDHSGSYSINVGADGSYDAELSLTPEEGAHRLVVKLTSGAALVYYICYSAASGYYFPSNGLAQKNREVLSHIYDAPEQAAGYYLSAGADAGEISSALEQIKLLAIDVTKGIESDYEKARAICSFVSRTIYYDHDARTNAVDAQTIALYNVLRTDRTVCAGFANLFCAMCEAVDIDAVNIKGGATNDDVEYEQLTDGIQNHEFAAFYSKDKQRWVWADACWNGAGNYHDGEYEAGKPKEKYFDITDEALSLDHRADKAERRRYFSALAQIKPDVEEADEGSLQSEQTKTDETREEPQSAPANTLPQGPAQEERKAQSIFEDLPDSFFIVIIAVLSAASAVMLAIVIRTILKNRKG